MERLESEPQQQSEVIEVLEPNWPAFQVWQRCLPQILPMGGTFSVAAAEVRAVCAALRERMSADLLDKVRHMASVADGLRASK